MKNMFCLLSALFLVQLAGSQQIKETGGGIIRDAGYRAEQQVRDAAGNGTDRPGNKAKNDKEKKPTIPAKENQAAIQEEGEGFITLMLSTPVTSKGLSVTIRGASCKYGKWNTVKVKIKSPTAEEEVSVALSERGLYIIEYDKLLEDGDYMITATSSDGKATKSERLYVRDIYQPQDETTDLMNAVGEAFNRLQAREKALRAMLSSNDAAMLQAKVQGVKEKADDLNKVLLDLHNAKKEIANLDKAGRRPSKNIRHNLSELNNHIAAQTERAKKLKELTEHEPFDNTVCEYIAMLNEACAAFSTFTNFSTFTLPAILKNIVLDKAVPKATEKSIDVANPVVFKNEIAGDELTWGAKEASKIFATATFDMKGLASKLGKAGFAGDVVQFATDVLLKTHCGVFKGTVSHYYNFRSKNGTGAAWWDYSVQGEAAITLRYPKSNQGIIRMKGTIEGNATKFLCTVDPELNPDYQQGTGGKVQTTVLKTYTPYELPFATALYDELGFGMAARALATPAYFLIPVDAEYNTQTGTVKIFINEAIVDFLPTIFNSQKYVQWVAGLPKLRRTDYPISKARLTLNASLKDKNEFPVKNDGKGTPVISETVKRHIPGDEREHFLDFTIHAKKE